MRGNCRQETGWQGAFAERSREPGVAFSHNQNKEWRLRNERPDGETAVCERWANSDRLQSRDFERFRLPKWRLVASDGAILRRTSGGRPVHKSFPEDRCRPACVLRVAAPGYFPAKTNHFRISNVPDHGRACQEGRCRGDERKKPEQRRKQAGNCCARARKRLEGHCAGTGSVWRT